jgi:membrane-associated PAP2 superfamily phosphatase
MIGAGIYMALSQSASEQATVFDVFFHGIGFYFIARGVWVLSTLIHRNEST